MARAPQAVSKPSTVDWGARDCLRENASALPGATRHYGPVACENQLRKVLLLGGTGADEMEKCVYTMALKVEERTIGSDEVGSGHSYDSRYLAAMRTLLPLAAHQSDVGLRIALRRLGCMH